MYHRKDYYQEGNRVYSELDVHDAYRRALNTWAKWVDSNVDPKKTTVFFRGYSASHFRYGTISEPLQVLQDVLYELLMFTNCFCYAVGVNGIRAAVATRKQSQ